MRALIRKAAAAGLGIGLMAAGAGLAEENCAEAQRLLRQGVELSDASAEEEQAYRRALELCPKLPEAQYNLGLIALKRGQPSAAAEALEKALAFERRSPFLLALAEVRVQASDHEGARQLYEEVLQQDDKNVKALQGLSVVFDKSGSQDRAIEQLEKARTIDPEDALTHYNLAVLRERAGDLNRAVEEYKRALELDPNLFSANFFLGLLYKKMQQYEAAAAVLAKAAQLEPDNAEVHKALGVSYEKMADYERAELAFRRAAELDEADVDSQVNLAVTMIRGKRQAFAEEHLLAIKPRFPRNARLLGVLGWAQLELGKYDKAEESLKSSLALDAMNPVAHRNLAALYERTGRAEEAKREYRAAVQLDPAAK